MSNKLSLYVNGYGAFCNRNHEQINYGQTGNYWTDATACGEYMWFQPDVDAYAIKVKAKHIFKEDDTYLNGTEIE
jgi:hypothetical protein